MKIIGFLIILLIISVIPIANAQVSLGLTAEQKSVEITISPIGEVHVKHIVYPSNYPKDLELISGTVSDISVTNEQGEEILASTNNDKSIVLVETSEEETIVEYNLQNALSQKDNFWTWDFSYIETTAFIFPEVVDTIFLNQNPVFLGEKKGINCHGCQMILEYAINEPNVVKQVNWEDKEFFVEIKTFTEIENFDFNQPAKEISFKINDSNQYITTVIPLELLWNPYIVFLDDEKIIEKEFNNNGTHISLNIRPETSGEVKIIGTTVVPEFPIIAPLAIGFLIILAVPLIRKFNLH